MNHPTSGGILLENIGLVGTARYRRLVVHGAPLVRWGRSQQSSQISPQGE